MLSRVRADKLKALAITGEKRATTLPELPTVAEAGRVTAQPRCEALGAEPAGNSPEEFARLIRDDQAKWSMLMREAGIEPE